jgi:hypothetical protein
LLLPVGAGQYPHGLPAAVLLSLDAVRAGDGTGICSAVMDLMSVLSAAGVPRALLYAAGQAGALKRGRMRRVKVPPEVVDEALGRLAGSSLLTFSVDGGTVAAVPAHHRSHEGAGDLSPARSRPSAAAGKAPAGRT